MTIPSHRPHRHHLVYTFPTEEYSEIVLRNACRHLAAGSGPVKESTVEIVLTLMIPYTSSRNFPFILTTWIHLALKYCITLYNWVVLSCLLPVAHVSTFQLLFGRSHCTALCLVVQYFQRQFCKVIKLIVVLLVLDFCSVDIAWVYAIVHAAAKIKTGDG